MAPGRIAVASTLRFATLESLTDDGSLDDVAGLGELGRQLPVGSLVFLPLLFDAFTFGHKLRSLLRAVPIVLYDRPRGEPSPTRPTPPVFPQKNQEFCKCCPSRQRSERRTIQKLGLLTKIRDAGSLDAPRIYNNNPVDQEIHRQEFPAINH